MLTSAPDSWFRAQGLGFRVLIADRSGQTMVGSSITGGHVASSSNQE